MWQSQSTPNEAKHSQMIEKDHFVKVSEKENGGAVVRQDLLYLLKCEINKCMGAATALYTCASLLAEGLIMLDVIPSPGISSNTSV